MLATWYASIRAAPHAGHACVSRAWWQPVVVGERHPYLAFRGCARSGGRAGKLRAHSEGIRPHRCWSGRGPCIRGAAVQVCANGAESPPGGRATNARQHLACQTASMPACCVCIKTTDASHRRFRSRGWAMGRGTAGSAPPAFIVSWRSNSSMGKGRVSSTRRGGGRSSSRWRGRDCWGRSPILISYGYLEHRFSLCHCLAEKTAMPRRVYR